MTDDAREAGRRLIDSIHAFERDPATEEWGKALVARSVAANQQSTSAQLSQAQRDLAASQADLTVMQAQRDEARAEAEEMRAQVEHWLTKARDIARELARANYENRRLTAELDSALRRLSETRTEEKA